jgi:hypothetical protein
VEEIPDPSGNIAGEEPYKVGYKKPPKETQFGGPRAPKRGNKPKDFDQWRKLVVKLMNEIAIDAKTGGPLMLKDANGVEHVATNAEMIARSWIQNPKRQRDATEAAFGKVPDQSENFNINLDDLSDEQLEIIANGGSIRSAIARSGKVKT